MYIKVSKNWFYVVFVFVQLKIELDSVKKKKRKKKMICTKTWADFCEKKEKKQGMKKNTKWSWSCETLVAKHIYNDVVAKAIIVDCWQATTRTKISKGNEKT